jgi:GNAT superfamily N-acetyltransferase
MNTADFSSEIRAAKREDAAALAALLVELGFPAPSDVVAARFEVFTGAGEAVLVSAQGAEVLGLVTLHVTHVVHRPTPVGRLTALVVAARARGHGIGRALVEAAEQLLAARGWAAIRVKADRPGSSAVLPAHTVPCSGSARGSRLDRRSCLWAAYLR